jgi:hypothetical protein
MLNFKMVRFIKVKSSKYQNPKWNGKDLESSSGRTPLSTLDTGPTIRLTGMVRSTTLMEMFTLVILKMASGKALAFRNPSTVISTWESGAKT